jgi:pimeloyl-ACP methyl ester carboxylesterase
VDNLRIYGRSPFNVAVVHGGPGAPGEMAPVARILSSCVGVLEPLQTATSVEGQIEELRDIIEEKGEPPLTLIGFSWGAWLSYLFCACYPLLVKKLILISSGSYEEEYAVNIMKTRLDRLSQEEKAETLRLIDTLNSSASVGDNIMARFGELMLKADSYALLSHDSEALAYQYDIYRNVWEQANIMRSSGNLLKLGEKIRCEVVAIHGDYDPHPAEGVKEPLSRIIKDFRFLLLKRCGHYPWLEQHARDMFYNILKSEVGLCNNNRKLIQ